MRQRTHLARGSHPNIEEELCKVVRADSSEVLSTGSKLVQPRKGRKVTSPRNFCSKERKQAK